MHRDVKNWRELSDEDIRDLFLAYVQIGVDMDKIPQRCAECFAAEFEAWLSPLTNERELKECLNILAEYRQAKNEQLS